MHVADPAPLTDSFGRQITYVRLSVTDRCDLRCRYCMAEQMVFLPRSQILTLEELARLGQVFTGLGVTRIRVTGGEPLARSNVISLFESLGRLAQLRDLTLTTNGTRLARFAAPLKNAGVTRINISLDSLRPDRFRDTTRVGDLGTVLGGIEAALAIEEMPLGTIGDHDRRETYYSSDAILDDLTRAFDLVASTETTGGPSRYYRAVGYDGRIGLISPHSHNFCDTCNRVRVTSDGRLLPCLGREHSVDLRCVLRSHPLDDERVRAAIIGRHMNVTGG
ncbi:MAG: molybdenum cofactor biosynthesis protein [Proteobacteria bacterium]|nr:molybdenum cofactor biosynthesis protein [Pseudomonadota bacterium]